MENWKAIQGYEGLYEVSDLGRVRALPRQVRNTAKSVRRLQGGIMKPYLQTAGYYVVKLSRAQKRVSKYVHRLVAEAFIGPCPKGEEVRHRDGRKLHCELTNLRYGTRLENVEDSMVTGTIPHGAKHGRAKLTEQQALAIIAAEGSYSEIAKRLGTTKNNARNIKLGVSWRHLPRPYEMCPPRPTRRQRQAGRG